jgi:hypothetical protein
MNGLNLDPGLRQAFNQQTHQRLLTEATRSRMAKCVLAEVPDTGKDERLPLRWKIKVIAQIIQEAGSTIFSIARAKDSSLNA